MVYNFNIIYYIFKLLNWRLWHKGNVCILSAGRFFKYLFRVYQGNVVRQDNIVFSNNIIISWLFLFILHTINQFYKENHIINEHFENLLYK